jgi:hypothetical protein
MNNAINLDLTFALKDNVLVSIANVARGLACECVCPACNGPLIAKKGQVNQHHFAHHNADNCGKGVETVIHMLAKEAIVKHRVVLLPGESVPTPLSYVESECRQLGFISDLSVALEETGELVEIEILVTHAVDDIKLAKVKEQGVKMIEIDLSPFLLGFDSKEQLERYVISEARREWLSNGGDIVREEETVLDSVSVVPERWITTGYKYATGYSKKKQAEFTFAALHVLKKMEGFSNANYTIHGMGGFETIDLRIDTNSVVLSKLKEHSFPVELTLGIEFKQTERGMEYCVVDVYS